MMADKKQVLRLLKTARGQLDGILKMVEEDRYCLEISQQVMAAEAMINRANRDPVYTDTMLIGDVTFFRTAGYALTADAVTCPVITAPAVNMGIVVRDGGDADRARRVMRGRMEKILALFARWGCSRLILGAYGCGVFRNDPVDVARFWQELLVGEGWGRLFEQVSFSILERPGQGGNIAPFRQIFGGPTNI